ncbi:trypsin-like peptidase domain-containing protein [Sansalvadorimonas sp. 2012CJ34-2]|uniref:Trypsin-like peptidase domain-containing protein n=1 Tax=Parendozoicomonas callyspongiae TaxID=2942213 RepID=A0ABT0PBW8_9GAMM|nr:trypsin-like peptidase domain-containing protein [Sansalvadorimonas sp. 2012CJ34-2]MCL6268877.1 trypsin-like peptidase domain-containing protein [Sansalvadorimonas sp. 2012CJ34-2]
MTRFLRTLSWFGWPTLCGLLVAFLLLQQYPSLSGIQPPQSQQTEIIPFNGPMSFNSAVEKAAPSVVSIFTQRSLRRPKNHDNNLINDSYSQNRVPRRQLVQSSLGSGVIVSPAGYILTNNHVINGADDIIVALQDYRETRAAVIGSDPDTDLAVLKIDLDDLPSADWANSKEVRIGDIVLAIGNPFGLGQTVSQGIISATRRDLRLSTYEGFLQTDAAINIGNSGGALVNTKGELVGISTAIISSDGGSEGLGFAIPSNLAKFVMTSIVERGRVIRGWLGIESTALSSELAEAFNLPLGSGILISGIYDGGPADQAGLQRGDIILRINDMVTYDARRVMNKVAKLKPGSKVSIVVLRNGKELSLLTEVGERPDSVPRT